MRHVICYNADGSLYGPADPEMSKLSGDWTDVKTILSEGGHLELWNDESDKDRDCKDLKEALDFLRDGHLENIEDSEWVIYHKSDAGDPDLHEGGPWFYHPRDFVDNEVYSEGYSSKDAAIDACLSEITEPDWSEAEA